MSGNRMNVYVINILYKMFSELFAALWPDKNKNKGYSIMQLTAK